MRTGAGGSTMADAPRGKLEPVAGAVRRSAFGTVRCVRMFATRAHA